MGSAQTISYGRYICFSAQISSKSIRLGHLSTKMCYSVVTLVPRLTTRGNLVTTLSATWHHCRKSRDDILTSEGDQMKRWKEHFDELLSRPTPVNPPDSPPVEEILQINCERPGKDRESHSSSDER